jgi:hypothetical protein
MWESPRRSSMSRTTARTSASVPARAARGRSSCLTAFQSSPLNVES